MKISHSNYPILSFLYKDNFGEIPLLDDDRNYFKNSPEEYNYLVNLFHKNKDVFKKEINAISEPFKNATFKAADKLMPLYQEMIDNGDKLIFSGTYILDRDHVYMIKHIRPQGYVIKQDGRENDNTIAETVFFRFSRQGMLISSLHIYKGITRMWMSSALDDLTGALITKREWLLMQMRMVATIYMFQTYKSVELKIVEPHKKYKGINYKYVNDTNFKINYLNCKWFTELHTSGAFNVSGHWRLQPCKKDGKPTKELIWINEFQKSGYTSRARKEIQS